MRHSAGRFLVLVLFWALPVTAATQRPPAAAGPSLPALETSVVTASLYGGTGDDRLTSCAINSNGKIIFAGEKDGQGVVLVVDGATGKREHELRPGLARLRDLALGDDDTIYVTDGGTCAKISPDCQKVLWTGPGGKKIDVSSEGDVFVLAKRRITRLSPEGSSVGGWDRGGKDLCVDRRGKRIFIGSTVGGRSKKSGNPVFIPRVYVFDFDGKPLYTMWDYSPTEVDEAGQMADSRVGHLAYGPDGKVYLLGDSEGGNSPFRMDPHDKTKKLSKEVIGGTAFGDTWRVFRSVKIAFVARVEPEKGIVERASFFYGRQKGRKDRLEVGWSLGYGIDADEDGRVYVAARFSCKPQFTEDAVHKVIGPQTRKDRWGNPGHPYEAVLAVFTPDLKKLAYCSGFAQGDSDRYDSTGLGAAGRNGLTAMAGVATMPEDSAPANAHETIYVSEDAPQKAYGGGKDGYYVVLGKSRPAVAEKPEKPEEKTRSARAARRPRPKPGAPGMRWMAANKAKLAEYRKRLEDRRYEDAAGALAKAQGNLQGEGVAEACAFLNKALKSAAEMKQQIIKNAARKRPQVYADLLRTRGRVTQASAGNLMLSAMGQRVPLPWSGISDAGFAQAYLKCAGESAESLKNAALFAVMAGDSATLQKVTSKLWARNRTAHAEVVGYSKQYMER